MVGVLTRLLSDGHVAGLYGARLGLNLVSWDRQLVARICKVISIGLVGLLAFFCRTKAARRDDPRLLGEWSLVVLTMLFVSERSWKHHFVTLLLPFTFLVAQMFRPALSRGAARSPRGASGWPPP